MEQFDVIVIGGGPGGYVAAVRASQLGLKTALVEKEHIGGVCLNWGCIPTKSLLRNAEVIHLLSKGRTFGFTFNNLSVDYSEAHRRSRSVVKRQTRRVSFLMKHHEVSLYDGLARLKSTHEIKIEPSGEILDGKHIIIATGARPRPLKDAPFDGDSVINYRDALNLAETPSSALVVGAGPIGMEFATLWSRYGSKVTTVEIMPNVLPLEDEDISIESEKQFKRAGINIKTGATIETIAPTGEGIDVTVSTGDDKEVITVDKILMAIGFSPNSEDLGLDKAGVKTTQGYIEIDNQMRTNIPNIYAIGDVTGKLGLAHVASAQGVIAAEAAAGRKTEVLDYVNIPRCTYAYPEVASVGLTEKEARERGHEVVTAKCPFAANGKALAMDENFGFAKIIGEAGGKKILGVHLIGGHVTELVAGPSGMMTLESTARQLGSAIHPHPTMGEAVREAAQALVGHAIHM